MAEVKAEDYKCCQCGNQAAAFWPCIDPDIQIHPYCRECLDKAQNELLLELHDVGVLSRVDEGLLG